jgi:two-component system CheB/CheR fusion protein
VSKDRLARFFTSEGSSYLISKQVRDMCVFSSHSVVRDPPFSRIDLISCRNLLIYLNNEMQDQIIPVFHYALKAGGFLFLGTSENLTQHGDLFSPIDKKNRLYQRRGGDGSLHLPPLVRRLTRASGEAEGRKAPAGSSLRQSVEARVLERHVPPHVVTSREGDIVFYSGGTGKYLEAPPGRPSRSLMAMARKGLRLPLRSALQEAVDQGHAVLRDSIPIELEDHNEFVRISVEPLRKDGGETLYLVVFNELREAVSEADDETARSKPIARDPGHGQIDIELRDTRDRLQAMAEEYETAIEELKSSNEEMVSVNEELQSANEELETSKEELQSVNEELQTVNHELTIKIDELDRANADLKNLYEATDIATIFLDRNLVIRSFTPAVTRIFSLLPGDRGRPLTDIAHHLDYPELAQDIQQIFGARQAFERRVDRRDGGAHYILRALPYWTGNGKVEGAVLTFNEVTSLARAEEHQRILVAELNHRVKNMLTVITGIATLTLKDSSSPESFGKSFLDRLHALARSYELVSRDQWSNVSLADLLRQEMEPYLLERTDRVGLKGPEVSLKPKFALSLGMVVHELGTNAAKYGSLSVAGGSLEVTWVIERRRKPCLVIEWKERGGPVIKEFPRRGFGLSLIEREISHGLGGRVRVDFEADGLRIELELPLESE